MKELLRKYYKMNNEEKEELENLFILHKLQKALENNKEIEFTISEEEIIFEVARDCMKFSNISCQEIITRLLKILECGNITAYQIEDLGTNELIELLEKSGKNFKTNNLELDIVTAFLFSNFYCVLMKEKGKYMLIYEKDDGTQYLDKFSDLHELLSYIIKCKLKEKGENVV